MTHLTEPSSLDGGSVAGRDLMTSDLLTQSAAPLCGTWEVIVVAR